MKVTLTSMQGNTHTISLMSKQEVLDFIELYKSTLTKSQRVKITCDLIGIDGYLQGTRQGLTPLVCSLFFLYIYFYFMYHTSDKNIQILGK